MLFLIFFPFLWRIFSFKFIIFFISRTKSPYVYCKHITSKSANSPWIMLSTRLVNYFSSRFSRQQPSKRQDHLTEGDTPTASNGGNERHQRQKHSTKGNSSGSRLKRGFFQHHASSEKRKGVDRMRKCVSVSSHYLAAV